MKYGYLKITANHKFKFVVGEECVAVCRSVER